MVLLGNKCDLEDERVVSQSEAKDLAKEWQCECIESSVRRVVRAEASVGSRRNGTRDAGEE